MKRRRGWAVVVGIVVFLLSTAVGLTVATSAPAIERIGEFDMPAEQTRAFVATAARKLDWRPGPDSQSFRAPLLPWRQTTITIHVEPKGSGCRVILAGHATRVGELISLLQRQLPRL